MPRVGIALGSNLGDRLAHLAGRPRLPAGNRHARRAVPAASIYQTEPLLCPPGSPFFYNSVVEIGFEGDPFELLELTQSIERKLGRTGSPERNAPRVIDVDLLYFGDQIIDTGERWSSPIRASASGVSSCNRWPRSARTSSCPDTPASIATLLDATRIRRAAAGPPSRVVQDFSPFFPIARAAGILFPP